MNENSRLSPSQVFGNPNFKAISFGGYRDANHDSEPTVEQLKEDLKILHAMGVHLLRTYKLHKPHASNVLKAIHQLKQENPNFKMYVVVGAWINCKDAFKANPNHKEEDENNEWEIKRAAELANQYPDIVKAIAVGNEAMVKWAESYYVQPGVILKWVNYLQDLKKNGKLKEELWITSSDNFASWGGGDSEYHVPDLEKLIRSVDFIMMHTYPMLDTHYNPDFWFTPESEENLSDLEKIDAAMLRAKSFAQKQYKSVINYMKSLGVDKPVHIGETGWASSSDGYFGPGGSKTCDEYKEGVYYKHMREWTQKDSISCFYFEAFDEPWKDAANPAGSENHFGLFTVDGQAKYALWNLVNRGVFEGLTRNGNLIRKTQNGDESIIIKATLAPPLYSKN
ncbi:MAG: glycosyl hydrolase family 17 [Flavobacteriaceae bacterium CG_4_8_14_3_um_filter_34_10]|nr:glycosyl hydrolase family 17 [Flavobacteriia bacterium]PIQ17700.1 MAG: glycosyl hydrolase family 17 [Flavobacteriaceae bacterium CG18_big_fil_WC_8_21_14_2_50_34_36]PIV51215.1 MAG: glycosyl hydrolase family 17 [Flavobacteriaceae bacterium CG02_land_8_20_14_3_00_34_13]PIX09241.1 MAG: glycosyl hydrolase family 17 [Flavobacteriaceae bacterium CG_4_8_14_3_um_filter_34_10]PIZ07857.1 MAG: glycosyl hydrolase family 17 [Flavobacteriaceae bacterium CG_4_10_14_0_8_um_filter_34_31]PJC07445.1 MAG: glyco